MSDEMPEVSDKTIEVLNDNFKQLSPLFEEWAISQREFPFNMNLDLAIDNSAGCLRYSDKQTEKYYWAFHAGYIRADKS